MKICLVGQGAVANKHLDGIKNIDDVEVVSIVGGTTETTEVVAREKGIPHWTTDLDEGISQPGVEAVIITSPTQIHADQAVHCLQAGKHVEIEIPISDSLADAKRIQETQQETGLIAMGGHTRRFNPSHQWIHNKIKAGELRIQQMDVIMTASTPGWLIPSSRSVVQCGMPFSLATTSVVSAVPPTIETTSTSSIFFIPSRCLFANAP